jgi:Fic family protein
MQSFRDLDSHLGMTPAFLVRQLTEIDIAKGRQEMYRRQHPEALKALRDIARVQSVEASNAIEDVTAPPKRIRELVEDKTTPRNRSEAEIAGYRSVLDLIHANADGIPFKPNVLLQLHRDLYQFTGVRAGRWKSLDNEVEEELPDGTKRVRFKPLSALETPGAMEELHRHFNEVWALDTYHRLLVTGAYVLDFSVIHPFTDGNGRMSRLLTLLLLYHGNYEVGRFVSLEKLIDRTRDSYYEALATSTEGWHEGKHDLVPWLSYFLGIVVAGYGQFEERVGIVSGGRGAKARAIRNFVRSRTSVTLRVEDVRQGVPGVSDIYIREVLRKLRDQGILRQHGRGPLAEWERLHTDF